MTKTNINSHEGFKYGIIALVLVLLLVILIQLLNDSLSLLIGALAISIGIFAFIGLMKSLKGLKEPNTIKKIIGILINLIIVVLFLFIIIENVLDIYRAIS